MLFLIVKRHEGQYFYPLRPPPPPPREPPPPPEDLPPPKLPPLLREGELIVPLLLDGELLLLDGVNVLSLREREELLKSLFLVLLVFVLPSL